MFSKGTHKYKQTRKQQDIYEIMYKFAWPHET